MPIDGMDEFIDELDRIRQTAEGLDGQEVPFDQLFTPKFMARYTDAPDIDTFLDNGPWSIENSEDFENIPQTELDRYVDEHSQFRTWDQMKGEAGNQWVDKQFNV